MRKALKLLFFGAVVLSAAGLGYLILGNYNIASNDAVVADVFRGKISVLGNRNDITIEAGSKVAVLTLVGSANQVTIEPGAEVGQIRGGGLDNEIVVPEGMDVDTSFLLTGEGQAPPEEQEQEPAGGQRELDGL